MKRFPKGSKESCSRTGTSKMQQDIEKAILSIVKEQQETLETRSSVESSLSEDDLKDYLHEVLDEVKEVKRSETTDNRTSSFNGLT
jgi:hypothetical protein